MEGGHIAVCGAKSERRCVMSDQAEIAAAAELFRIRRLGFYYEPVRQAQDNP